MFSSIPDDDPLRPAVILGIFYGLRRSEVLGLRWKDINFINKTIQAFPGHCQASTTLNIYLHSIVRGGQVAAQTMGKIIAS